MGRVSFSNSGTSVDQYQPRVALRFYRQLAENCLGPMCCHDLEGTLLWVNSTAARSLGYSPEEGVGTRLDSYLVPEVRPLFAFYLARVRRRGADSGIVHLKTKQGEQRVWMYRNILSDEPELPPHVFGHALDITEQFRAEQALKDLFEQAPLAYLHLDPQNEVRRANRAACELLGYSERQILRSERPSNVSELIGFCATASEQPRLITFTRNDGRTLFLDIRARPVFAADSFRMGLFCALIDVTERVQAETEFRNLNAQLEARVASRTTALRRSNADLQEFAFVVSHDLQAPLKQVESVLEQLESRSNDSDSAELLRRSQADLRRMSILIESVLNYALVSNTVDHPPREVPLALAIEESLMSLASVIAASGAFIDYENLPHISVDETNLVQLFQNLIGNAIKYRGPEAPRISISAESDDDFWTVAVADNGIGIEPANFEQIFEPFRRLHGKEYAGCGIGLAICKKIVKRIGGKIWVESLPGHGSTFRFTIPG